jgi:hypothetical protein
MLILAKALAVVVLIWFFSSAKEKGEPPINWAITGLIGYLIVWLLVNYTLVAALSKAVEKNASAGFMLVQIPALCAIAAAFFIRKKLIANADAEKND